MSYFPRPARPTHRPPVVRPPPPRKKEAPPPDPDAPPAADRKGSIALLVVLVLTAATMNGFQPAAIARYVAVCTGVGIAISIGFDLRRGIRNLQRADLFAILAYYFLTLFEFLFPQPGFDKMLSAASAMEGLKVCLIGLAGLVVGRHLMVPKRQPFRTTLRHEIPRGWMIAIFLLALVIGYSNMLAAVHWDVREMLKWFMAARFTQPWTRERLGSWSSLLYELSMLIQLVPPLAGVILARRHRYSVLHLLVVIAGLGLTLFYGFSSGTRNVFATYLVTFLMGYALAVPRGRSLEVGILAAVCAALMGFATFYMLQFREFGLKDYMSGTHRYMPEATEDKKTLFIDLNLFSICKLVDVFPHNHEYLGFEIPYQALIRPIPRAIWPNKPTGLTLSIEDAMNVEGLTISATFAGEAYMSGGTAVVLLTGLALGAFLGWWGTLSSPHNSEVGHLVFASGFFAAVISMRSLFVFTTALLPPLAAIIISTLAVRVLIAQARRLLHRARPMPHMGPARPLPPRPTR